MKRLTHALIVLCFAAPALAIHVGSPLPDVAKHKASLGAVVSQHEVDLDFDLTSGLSDIETVSVQAILDYQPYNFLTFSARVGGGSQDTDDHSSNTAWACDLGVKTGFPIKDTKYIVGLAAMFCSSSAKQKDVEGCERDVTLDLFEAYISPLLEYREGRFKVYSGPVWWFGEVTATTKIRVDMTDRKIEKEVDSKRRSEFGFLTGLDISLTERARLIAEYIDIESSETLSVGLSFTF